MFNFWVYTQNTIELCLTRKTILKFKFYCGLHCFTCMSSRSATLIFRRESRLVHSAVTCVKCLISTPLQKPNHTFNVSPYQRLWWSGFFLLKRPGLCLTDQYCYHRDNNDNPEQQHTKHDPREIYNKVNIRILHTFLECFMETFNKSNCWFFQTSARIKRQHFSSTLSRLSQTGIKSVHYIFFCHWWVQIVILRVLKHYRMDFHRDKPIRNV